MMDNYHKNSEQSSLLQVSSKEQNDADYTRPEPSSTKSNNSGKRNDSENTFIKALIKGMESFLDWAPFITVQSLCGSRSPEYALGAGTFTAFFVLLYSLLKQYFHNRQLGFVFLPKILDSGQFILFGILYVTAKLIRAVWQDDAVGMYLLLWFNPFTTGGIAVIMYSSIQLGRPFVYDYAQSEMPPEVWNRLISKRWFQNILIEAAMFWVKIMTAMTAIVTIQPLLVTFFYGGDVTKDTSGFMIELGNWLTCVQFIILFYGIFDTYRNQQKGTRVKKRVRDMKQNGLTEKERNCYGESLDVKVLGSNHRIVSLNRKADLKEGAIVLTAAFAMEELFQEFLDTEEARFSFFYANVKSMSYFHHVLACVDDDINTDKDNIKVCKPKCVMACMPVLSKSQEETEVFCSYEAWVEHGFTIPGATETNFPLPNDDVIEMGKLRSRRVHGLRQQPYIYIAYFGADLNHKGKGYGRTLLNYVIEMSERKQLPLVLETSTVWNRTQYEKYGFQVIDCVKGRPNLVLMMRSVGQSNVSNV